MYCAAAAAVLRTIDHNDVYYIPKHFTCAICSPASSAICSKCGCKRSCRVRSIDYSIALYRSGVVFSVLLVVSDYCMILA
jgi:hypothetical protein